MQQSFILLSFASYETLFAFFPFPIAGCTFDEDSDPGLCEYRQGQEDDFDWQLIRTYNWPHPTTDLLRGRLQRVSPIQKLMASRFPRQQPGGDMKHDSPTQSWHFVFGAKPETVALHNFLK